MKQQKKFTEKGITLIALIVSIIVLLILAGVTIAAITGNENVLDKAQSAKNKTDIANAKEAATLKAVEYIQDYYQGKYVDNDNNVTSYSTAGAYVAKQFETQSQSGNYYMKTDVNTRDLKISLDAAQSNVIVEGTIEDDGTITWSDEVASGGGSTPANPTTPDPTGVTITKTSGGTEIEVGDEISLSATISPEGATGTIIWSCSPSGAVTFSPATGSTTTATGAQTVNGNVTITATVGEITSNSITIQVIDLSTAGKTASTQNRTLSGSTTVADMNSKNPVIPKGFIAVDVGEATWSYTDNTKTVVSGWNSGLVIEDAENQNQFVWVPCKTGNTSVDKITDTNNELVTYSKNYDAYPKNTTVADNGVSDASDSDGTYSAIPVTESTQIGTYGGFYVARFEAGLSNPSSNSSNNSVATPISKAGTKVWNNVDYITSYKSANSMINNSTKYGSNKSGLITGTQWDTIMQWYEKNGIKVGGTTVTGTQDWGTYKDRTYTINGDYFTYTGSANAWQPSTGDLEHTGNSDAASASNPRVYHASGLNSNGYKKNIADLGGNLWEWTAEVTSSHRVCRGGYAGNATSDYPASYRIDYGTDGTSYGRRFPCRALYSVALSTEFT